MLRLKGISYSIGDRELLNQVDLIINPGQRSALLGVNGSGKTTLLRIINGEIEPEDGEISKPNEYRIGYLPQELTGSVSGEVLEHVKSGREDILRVERRLHRLRESLHSDEEKERKIREKKLESAEAEFDAMSGYDLERTARKILFGLGFTGSDLESKMGELSGGWQMRANLARLLISDPDLLLLDEPTNHLDIKAIEWLEKFLSNFRGSVLVVTHDRFFIDRVTGSIFELMGRKLAFYNGDFEFFIRKKEADEALQVKKMKELVKKKEHLERFINRFRYKATKARQVKSREKEYEKLEDIELISAPDFLKFDIRISSPSYLDVMRAEELSFRYSRDWVLRGLNLSVTKGERIALIGENGSGKTTLAKLISGELTPVSGSLELGERTDIGFYAQHQADVLDPVKTVFESVADEVPETDQTVIRSVLGLFGFSGDDIHKRIGVLSGGEKSRVSLSRILMTPHNFLIMDEPTNHLDSISRDALEKALIHYDGTLLLVSHDRYFLDRIVTRVVELREGHLFDYDGNYSEYLNRREDGSAGFTGNGISPVSQPFRNRKEERKQRALSRQEISRERNSLQKKARNCETEIGRLEKEQEELDRKLSDHSTYDDSGLITSLQKRYSDIRNSLDSLYREWEDAQTRIEELLAGLEEK